MVGYTLKTGPIGLLDLLDMGYKRKWGIKITPGFGPGDWKNGVSVLRQGRLWMGQIWGGGDQEFDFV